MINQIFLALGTNLGDKKANLALAREEINATISPIVRTSSVYQTEAWGKTDQPDFYNQVVEIRSSINPEELLNKILALEKRLGRIRKEKWGTREIDIDILFVGDQTIATTTLNVPHPEIQNRKFVLAPLAEIASEFIHPTTRKTIKEMLALCADPLDVAKITV